MSAIEVSGEISERDYRRFVWLRLRPRRRWRALTWVLACVAAAGVVAVFVAVADLPREVVPLLAVLVVVPVLVAHLGMRRGYRQQRTLQGVHRSAFSESGVEWESPHGRGHAEWSTFCGWRESPHLFLLYQSVYLVNIVPKSWFRGGAADVDRFRDLLRVRRIECLD